VAACIKLESLRSLPRVQADPMRRGGPRSRSARWKAARLTQDYGRL